MDSSSERCLLVAQVVVCISLVHARRASVNCRRQGEADAARPGWLEAGPAQPVLSASTIFFRSRTFRLKILPRLWRGCSIAPRFVMTSTTRPTGCTRTDCIGIGLLPPAIDCLRMAVRSPGDCCLQLPARAIQDVDLYVPPSRRVPEYTAAAAFDRHC